MSEQLLVMLAELESNRLDVGLVPLNPRLRNYNEGGCKRVAFSKNTKWYRDFCCRHLSSRKRNHRKPDTRIKRANVLRALERMARGTYRGKYADDFAAIARRLAA